MQGKRDRRQLAARRCARSTGTSTRRRKYAPPAVRNWNWPDIADAFSQGTLGAYIDAHSSAAVLNNPEKSKVIGKIGFARWPRGTDRQARARRSGTGASRSTPRSTTRQKRATWLFISWAAAAETQARTSWKFAGPAKRSGVNRTSLWRAPEFVAMTQGHRAELRRGGADVARAGHRRRLAAARAAVAGDRRDDGHRDPVGAGRAEEVEGSARRGADAHRPDHEGALSRRRWRGDCAAARNTRLPVRTLAQQERRFALRAVRAGVRCVLVAHDDGAAGLPRVDEPDAHRPDDAVAVRLRRPRQLREDGRATRASGARSSLTFDLHGEHGRAAGRDRACARAAGDAHPARAGGDARRGDPADRARAGRRRPVLAHAGARARCRPRRRA